VPAEHDCGLGADAAREKEAPCRHARRCAMAGAWRARLGRRRGGGSYLDPRIDFRDPFQPLALAGLGDLMDFEFPLIDMSLDAVAHERTQVLGGDGVEFDDRLVAEFLLPLVGMLALRVRLGRPRRQVPLLDLIERNCYTLEMNLGMRSIASDF